MEVLHANTVRKTTSDPFNTGAIVILIKARFVRVFLYPFLKH
jgi:hypothetical protein